MRGADLGGYGSGRHGYKQKAEDCRSLDVNRFRRDGCLVPGRAGSWVWSRDGEEVGRIGYRAEQGAIVLNYRVRMYGGDWQPITETVGLIEANCHFGGTRTYFICPGVKNGTPCWRRVAKLYSGGKYFLCRHCYNISYYSQSEPAHERLLRRANKLRMSLGGEPGTASWIPPKPKGMWHRTYQRKLDEIDWCEGRADHLFLSRFRHLLSTDDIDTYFPH